MPFLSKKRTEFSLKRQVGYDAENPPTSEIVTQEMLSSGFRMFADDDYCSEQNVEELFIRLEGDNRPFAKVCVLGKELIGLLDSGAQRTVLGYGCKKLLREWKLKIFPAEIALKTASGSQVEVEGCVHLPVTFNNENKIISALVAPKLKQKLILGYDDFWKAFRIQPGVQSIGCIEKVDLTNISRVDEICTEDEQEEEIVEILNDLQKAQLESIKGLFKVAVDGETLETTPLITHKIDLKPEFVNAPPVRINPYPTSPELQKKINHELDNMIKLQVIEPSRSDWSLSTVPVIKPTGEVRLCLDARRLNDRTVRDAYPLPHQDRILSRLGSCKFLSTIDLTKAFLQIPLDPASRKYTAFSVLGRGLFQFCRLPFGLVNSPATLARLMDGVLGFGELEPNVFVYLDDIVVVSETFEAHLSLLSEVARRLKLANLSININKSKFCVSELPYLGYILTPEGLRPNPERIEAILNYERPNSLRSLRRFLGMANYYRRFIPHFSEMSAALTDLLKKKPKSLIWNPKAETSFLKLKESLIAAPVLANPNFDLPFQIQCDASDTAIAAILTQEHFDGERVVAYFSQKLSPAQQAYAASEKEGLAVLSAIEKFRPYIEGTHFIVVTDASALTHIMKGKWRTSSRLSRWSIELQGYDLEIRHRRGKDNVIPDALSRSLEISLLEEDGDAWYSMMYNKVLASPDEHIDFKIEEGKLFKFIPAQTEVLDYRFEWKLCVPERMREDILRKEHDESLHVGYEKLLEKLRARYFWPKLAFSARKYIEKCRICKECKPTNTSQHPTMGTARLATKPFQILAIDFIQSLPRSKTGNMHLLVLLDLFSKWTVLVPVKKICASLVVKILEEQWFRRYSVPEILISDNATSFHSNEFKDFLQKYQVQHWANSRHHSQANPVERLNRSINALIRTYVKQDQRLWDSKISQVEYTINNTWHSSTGFTPYKILYGHEIISTGEEHRRDADASEISDNERIETKLKIDRNIYDLVYKNLVKAHEKSERAYNLRFHKPAPVYQVGQRVFKRNFALSSAGDAYNAKLGPMYVPCTIVSRRGTSSYELIDEHGKNLGIFSAADLKPGNPE